MWGEIQIKANEGWFVPSKGEWSAFGEELGITEENYLSKNLKYGYWSSSQYNRYAAWNVAFHNGDMSAYRVFNDYYVRLGTTF